MPPVITARLRLAGTVEACDFMSTPTTPVTVAAAVPWRLTGSDGHGAGQGWQGPRGTKGAGC